jgi:hypothetical protein
MVNILGYDTDEPRNLFVAGVVLGCIIALLLAMAYVIFRLIGRMHKKPLKDPEEPVVPEAAEAPAEPRRRPFDGKEDMVVTLTAEEQPASQDNSETKLGLRVGSKLSCLEVLEVLPEGIVPRWNKEQSNPEHRIRVGDLLTDINGFFGSSEILLDQVSKAAIVTTLVKHMVPLEFLVEEEKETPLEVWEVDPVDPVEWSQVVKDFPMLENGSTDAKASTSPEVKPEEKPEDKQVYGIGRIQEVFIEEPMDFRNPLPEKDLDLNLGEQIVVDFEDGEMAGMQTEKELCAFI